MLTHESENLRGFNVNCVFENEGRLKITGSHVLYTVNVVIFRKRC